MTLPLPMAQQQVFAPFDKPMQAPSAALSGSANAVPPYKRPLDDQASRKMGLYVKAPFAEKDAVKKLSVDGLGAHLINLDEERLHTPVTQHSKRNRVFPRHG